MFELEAVIVPPYTESAAVYDHMMKDVDYKRWANYIIQLMEVGGLDSRHSNRQGKKLCELGSGTGNIASYLSKYGFDITGIDRSEQMTNAARQKFAGRSKRELKFFNHDMVTYRSPTQYDGIICVYDSMNYISGKRNIELFFKNVFFNLKFKGLFILDASLEPNSLNDQELFTQRGKIKNILYQRESSYDPKTKMHTTRIRIKKDGTVFEEIHNEYVYSLDTIRQAARKAGFTEIFAAGDFTLLDVNDDSERVHFVLTKQAHD